MRRKREVIISTLTLMGIAKLGFNIPWLKTAATTLRFKIVGAVFNRVSIILIKYESWKLSFANDSFCENCRLETTIFAIFCPSGIVGAGRDGLRRG